MKPGIAVIAIAIVMSACGPSTGVEPLPDSLHCSGPALLRVDHDGVVADYACPGPLGCTGGSHPQCDFRTVPNMSACPDFAEGMGFTDNLGGVVCRYGIWHRPMISPEPGAAL